MGKLTSDALGDLAERVLLPREIPVHLLFVTQVVGDDVVDVSEFQRGKLIFDSFRRRPLPIRPQHGLEGHASAPDAQGAVLFTDGRCLGRQIEDYQSVL